MPQPTIRLDAQSVLVDGRPGAILAGEFQYFRIERPLWAPSLKRLKEAGLQAVSAYVPWIWHEVSEGRFDFAGETDPKRDFVGFMSLCEQLGLPVLVKPGPYIFAEYQGFGVPDWLRREHPECLMQVSKPQRFPQPALNHPTYLALARRYFEAVAEVVRPFVPRGMVLALQLDNETGYPQFGQGPHMTDANPHSLDHLRAALETRFSSVHELNRLWGTDFASFAEVVPPEERRYGVGQFDTMARFVEDYICDYLAALKRMWEEIDLGVPLLLNDIWLDSWPSHLAKKNDVAPVGFDLYPRYSDLPVLFDQPYSVSFVPELFGAFARGGPLLALELGAGWLDPACEVTPEATLFSTMAAYAHGTAGVFYYILMDGTDPDGAYVFDPFIGIDGQPTERLQVLPKLRAFLDGFAHDLAASKPLKPRLAILHSPAITREMMSAALDPVGTLLSGRQRAVDEAMTIVSVNAGLYGALAEAGHPAAIENLDRADDETLAGYEALCFNSIGFVSPEAAAKLHRYVENGGKLLTLGTPFAPDSALFPLGVKRVLNPQALGVLAKVAWDYVKLYRRLPRIPHRFSAYTIEGMFPAMLMTRFAARAGVWLGDARRNARVWASRLVTLVAPAQSAAKPVTPLLSYRKSMVGYETAVGARGVSAFVGTLLGASFDTPGYTLDPPARKASVSSFLGDWLAKHAVAPAVTPLHEVELVRREGEGYVLLFAFNRGAAKAVELGVEAGATLDRQWAGGSSSGSAIGPGRLRLTLAPHDVWVARLVTA